LALAGQVELVQLIDLAAQHLGVNVEYDPAAISGTVTLRTGGGVGEQDLWDLLNRSLAVRGLTTIRVGGSLGGVGAARGEPAPSGDEPSYAVVRLADAATLAPRELLDRGDSPAAPLPGPVAGFRVVVVPVVHRPADAFIEPVSRVLSRTGASAAALDVRGPLVIADLSPRIAEAVALVRLLDIPRAAPTLVEIPLRSLTGAQMAALATQVVSRRDAVSGAPLIGDVLASPGGSAILLVAPAERLAEWEALIDALDRRQGVSTVTYTPMYFTAADVADLIGQTVPDVTDDRWKLVVDSLTGSVVITGTPVQHAAIESLLERLDQAPSAVRRPMRAIRVRNRSVVEMRDIVEQLLSSGFLEADAEFGSVAEAGATSRDPATGFTPAGSALATRTSPVLPGRGGGEPEPSARPLTSGSRPSEAGVTLAVDEATSTLIAIGDPRVLTQIEALIHTLDVRQPQVMLEVLMVTLTDTQSRDLGVELESIGVSDDVVSRISSLFGLGRRTPEGDLTGPLQAQGLTGVVLNPGDFSVVVRALRNVTRGRSLSMPRVLVGNNQEATLDAVVQQPVLSVNASDTIATTSFGGTQDAGTIVTVRPQIAEADHLVLEYNVSLSSFIGSSANPSLPPPRQQNSVTSVATIPDGHTVVVGGIDVDSHSTGKSDIPFFGDIPILGDILASHSRDDSHSRFYVFIRASILRSGGFEDLRHISAQSLEQAGIPDGWPRIAPVVMP
jgi:general secretion pathway protein D